MLLPRAWALASTRAGAGATLPPSEPWYPKTFSATSPTRGAAVAPTAPSKERSKAYTALRSCSGTISANMAELLVPLLHSTAPAHETNSVQAASGSLSRGRIC